MATLGERIKQLRTEYEMTQEEFGKLFGVTKYAVSLYESGKSVPNDEIKKKMAEYFGVSLDWLMGISNVRNPSPPKKTIDDTSDIDVRLTKKDKRDIAKELEKLMDDIEHSDGLSAYNNQLTDEQKELIKNALEIALKVVKIKNKEKYTPKKYRKE